MHSFNVFVFGIVIMICINSSVDLEYIASKYEENERQCYREQSNRWPRYSIVGPQNECHFIQILNEKSTFDYPEEHILYIHTLEH